MDLKELRERQNWTLFQKIDHSLGTIDAFISRMGGPERCYVSFSGGKDSTVLLDLVRQISTNVPAVFINTGNEYPEIIQFVARHREEWNITTLHPQFTPRQVWARYGFPLVSKETAQKVHKVRVNPNTKTAAIILDDTNKFQLAKRWRFLISAAYESSGACCEYLKKKPAHKYEKDTGRRPILGIMATESKLREKSYLHRGGVQRFRRHPRREFSPAFNLDRGGYLGVYTPPKSRYFRHL